MLALWLENVIYARKDQCLVDPKSTGEVWLEKGG